MKTLAVIGFPLKHTLSPLLHNHLFALLGIDARYQALETAAEDLEQVAMRLRAGDLDGLNITRPHKIAFREYLDQVAPEAAIAGAVNCVSVDRAVLRGHNTDLAGIAQAFEVAGHDCSGEQVLLLGAGGAARAAVVALHRMDVAGITVAARRLTAAEELIAALPATHHPADFQAIELTPHLDSRPFGLLVNATPVGQWPRVDEALVGDGQLQREQVVFDMVYNPDNTLLLQRARSVGCKVISGLDMFVGQALASTELWFPGSTGFGSGSLQPGIDLSALKELLRAGILKSTGRSLTAKSTEASA